MSSIPLLILEISPVCLCSDGEVYDPSRRVAQDQCHAEVPPGLEGKAKGVGGLKAAAWRFAKALRGWFQAGTGVLLCWSHAGSHFSGVGPQKASSKSTHTPNGHQTRRGPPEPTGHWTLWSKESGLI